MRAKTGSGNTIEIRIDIPEGISPEELKSLVRDAIIQYLVREEGLDEKEARKLKITVEVEGE
ncbi:hypothetical protein [Thermococcus sp. Bubb.Bath]|uniref:hypothetical protein n=1 Tax=Thermococcus sp. Bubb.Bath TaxID=1638242 RepID=UPI0014398A69|nr:hypothetical protein [Thermococcus sp. Bubb.Bath]NJF24423.1 hypothetical protein [Thermococcus sp. Bubb.Bath]